jgi:hypothetical protein
MSKNVMPFGGGGSVVPSSSKGPSSTSTGVLFDLKEKKPFTLSNLGDIFKGMKLYVIGFALLPPLPWSLPTLSRPFHTMSRGKVCFCIKYEGRRAYIPHFYHHTDVAVSMNCTLLARL